MPNELLVNPRTVRADKVDLAFDWKHKPFSSIQERYICTNSLGRFQVWQVPDTPIMQKHDRYEVGGWIAMVNGVERLANNGTHTFENGPLAFEAAETTGIHEAAHVLRAAAKLLERIEE